MDANPPPIDREADEARRRHNLAAEYRGTIIDWSVHLESLLWGLLSRMREHPSYRDVIDAELGPRRGKGPPATTQMIDALAGVFDAEALTASLLPDSALVIARRELVTALRHVNSLRRLLVHGEVDTGVHPESRRTNRDDDVVFFAWWSSKPEVVSRRRVATAVRAAQKAAIGLGHTAGSPLRA